ncbi:hypothetical protein ZHAS_00008892 [Anopheles sinensis]|uniref:Secreted protein n=1 Tax=Anopheles sinensis TaxID=74873 RepID=A0A084VTK4_ANOSI|nr:hypothetical protein ZHAS_00008892 [Anopheles sinensis]
MVGILAWHISFALLFADLLRRFFGASVHAPQGVIGTVMHLCQGMRHRTVSLKHVGPLRGRASKKPERMLLCNDHDDLLSR